MFSVDKIFYYCNENQEDGIIVNKTSVDRGMSYLCQRTYYQMKLNKDGEIFTKPNPQITLKMKTGNYDNLNDNGAPKLNQTMKKGDIIMGKVILNEDPDTKNEHPYVDTSIPIDEEGVIESVEFIDENTLLRVIVRAKLLPVAGDKFC